MKFPSHSVDYGSRTPAQDQAFPFGASPRTVTNMILLTSGPAIPFTSKGSYA